MADTSTTSTDTKDSHEHRIECPLCRQKVKYPRQRVRLQCPRCGYKFNYDPTPYDATTGEKPDPRLSRPGYRPPVVLQGYRFQEPLGKGGMSLVVKAIQESMNRTVAVKLLPIALAKEDTRGFKDRFEREAKMVGRMVHPNIVKIIDRSPVNTDGPTFFVMEYINGPTLRRLLAKGPLPENAVQDLLVKVVKGIKYAHEMGVIHRDIKPDNVMVDEDGEPRICDFGIASLFVDERGHVHLTRTGTNLGTPAYMAPEQIDAPGKVSAQADLYSLGVMAYELLTGERPVGRFELPTAVNPALSPLWDDFIERLLQPRPEHRPASAGVVLTLLQGIQSGQALTGRTVGHARVSAVADDVPTDVAGRDPDATPLPGMTPLPFSPRPGYPVATPGAVAMGRPVSTGAPRWDAGETTGSGHPGRPSAWTSLATKRRGQAIALGLLLVLQVASLLLLPIILPSAESDAAGDASTGDGKSQPPDATPSNDTGNNAGDNADPDGDTPEDTDDPERPNRLGTLSVRLTSPADGLRTNARSLDITGQITGAGFEDVEVVEVFGQRQRPAPEDGRFAVTAELTEEGAQTLAVRIRDKFGHTRTVEAGNVIVDWSAPVVQIAAGPEVRSRLKVVTIMVHITDASGVESWEIDGTPGPRLVDNLAEMRVALSPGENRLAIRAVDTLGNVSEPVEIVTTFEPITPGLVQSLRDRARRLAFTPDAMGVDTLVTQLRTLLRECQGSEHEAAIQALLDGLPGSVWPVGLTYRGLGRHGEARFHRPRDGMTVVLVPAGTFGMGSDTLSALEAPARDVPILGYFIDQHEVTTAQFAQFLEANPAWLAAHRGAVGTPPVPLQYLTVTTAAPFAPVDATAGDYPVVFVSQEAAAAYAQWVGGHLPTAFQWEKAARGTDGADFPWGSPSDIGMRQRTEIPVWPADAPTGDVSPLGIHGMGTGVPEWTRDVFTLDDGAGTVAEVRGFAALPVSGGWLYDPQPSALRVFTSPATTGFIGFRTAMVMPSEPTVYTSPLTAPTAESVASFEATPMVTRR